MRTRIVRAFRIVASWGLRLLDVSLPMDALYGLSTRSPRSR
jgi:hypothetical protein